MIDNSYYSQDVHGPYELHDIGNLELEEGGTIRGCTLAYATFGALNPAKGNAILIPTWYSGTNKIMEQVYIGKGRALDPDKYFIIVVNQIGNGLSTSPHNTPAPAGMGNFPHVRIGDDVRAQHKFVTEAISAWRDRIRLELTECPCSRNRPPVDQPRRPNWKTSPPLIRACPLRRTIWKSWRAGSRKRRWRC